MAFPAAHSLDALSQSMAESVKTVQASIVHVSQRGNEPASGLVISSETVLTSDAALQNGREIMISLPHGRLHKAVIAGRDPDRDLALLRLPGPALSPGAFSKDDPQVGELVIALGCPNPGGLQASLGVLGRIDGPLRLENGSLLEQFIQTDAAPFVGFTGGALVNTLGKIVGMNTLRFAPALLTTIPIQIALQIAASLEKYGRVRRGYVGVRCQKVRLYASHRQELGRPQLTGLAIIRVEPDSPAARANLMTGDVITRINNQVVNNHSDLLSQIGSSSIDRTHNFEILRGSQRMVVHVPIREHR
jgi:S1-C subfamily serine protease